MRFGLVLAAGPLEELLAQAVAAEQSGFDLVWLREAPSLRSPTAVAAALAPGTTSIRVGVELTAGVNPVYLAEEVAVADLCLGGRLVLTLHSDDAGLLAETTDVVLDAIAARPFRHEGERWSIPANWPENEVNQEERIRVTPATAQLELPVWLAGAGAAHVARERALTYVGTSKDSTETLAREWQHTEARLNLAARRLRRVAARSVGLPLDDDGLVETLRADQRGWGLDVVLVELPDGTGLDDRLIAIEHLAARVLPRVQLDRLPPGLETYWKQRQETAR
jgi:alkanesulfonate monooxygenase SsuD/methylene tetrahydromethanopterin reductase-like flavin-dependent oxidoreductase (luciferase family)